MRNWVRPRAAWLWFGVELCGFSVVTLFTFAVTMIALVGTVIGLAGMAAAMIENGRQVADGYRRAAREWAGVAIPSPYLPIRPDIARTGFGDPQLTASLDRLRALLTDPATPRDLVWMVMSPVIGAVFGLLPVVAATYGLAVLALPECWYLVSGTPTPEAGVLDPIGLLGGAHAAAIPLGLALSVAPLPAARWFLAMQARTSALLLRPSRSVRVRELEESRSYATDTLAAELRRIERDLHDGAQARMVAVGIALRTLESLLDTDPEAARELVVEARATAGAALDDLRTLVRGVHPPVLAERGLVAAVRAVALDSPVHTHVEDHLRRRLDAPVEAALYFAVCELMANAAKHAEANWIFIDLHEDAGTVIVTVNDDGAGGADPARGNGLRGVERRVATFDGKMTMTSPPGGPTAVKLEIPCASSSLRTSTC